VEAGISFSTPVKLFHQIPLMKDIWAYLLCGDILFSVANGLRTSWEIKFILPLIS
jgi:hypothetical protein